MKTPGFVKQPAMYRKLAKYLAETFSVATETMNLMIATVMDMVICQPRSLILSLLYAHGESDQGADQVGWRSADEGDCVGA
jgi:hypothetical protein